MGSENSKPEKIYIERVNQIDKTYTDQAIQRALEEQRKIYEEKYEKLIKSNYLQIKTENKIQNSSQTLYPNLNSVTSGYIPQPSSSNTPETQYYPATPSAPSAPVNDVNVPKDESINSSSGALPKSRRCNRKKMSDNDYVTCVTCSSAFGQTIYQCSSGHSSCSYCKILNKKCGKCSNLITDMRNINLEVSIASMQKNNTNNDNRMKCPNSKDGCSLSFKKEALEEHVKECIYNDLECPLTKIFNNCKWQGKINHLRHHFNDMHPEYISDVDKEIKVLETDLEFYNIYFVNIGSFNFLIHFKQDKSKTMFMTVHMFGTKCSASKWTYELHVYNKKEIRRKFTFIDVCNPYSEPVESLFRKGQCAVLDQQYAKSFFNNNELNFKFYIKKNLVLKEKNDLILRK